MSKEERRVEPEHSGSLWKHPYLIYIGLTVALFLFLVVIGFVALSNNWIPAR